MLHEPFHVPGSSFLGWDRANALSYLYGAGSILLATSLLLPTWARRDDALLGAIALAAAGLAVAIYLLRAHIGGASSAALVGAGTMLIGAAAKAAGPVGTSVALGFVWVSLYSFYFYSWRFAAGLWAWSAFVCAATLFQNDPLNIALARWIFTSGTSLVSGTVVGALVRRVSKVALEDWLTGALNRRGWDSAIEAASGQAARTGEPLTVILVDLDNFKELNDRLGHGAGDDALCQVASAWRSRLRPYDILARLGGDEFGVGLVGCSGSDGAVVAEQFRDSVAGAFSCSIGIAEWNRREPMSELVERADAALYLAKSTGRNRAVVAAHQPRPGTAPARQT